MPLISSVHTTVHRYPAPACRSRNELRLQPRSGAGQSLVSFDLEIQPPAEVFADVDYFGNQVWLASIEADHRELTITASSVVEVAAQADVRGVVPWDPVHLALDPVREFTLPSPRVPRLAELAALMGELELPPDPAAALLAANRYLRVALHYEPGATGVTTALEEVLLRRTGVCQDFAHVMLAIARELGWPARYVSGNLAPEIGSASGESHAWIEVALPDSSWIGLDPTHAEVVKDRHVAVAVGRDYDDAAPIRGSFQSSLPGEVPVVMVSVRKLSPEVDWAQ